MDRITRRTFDRQAAPPAPAAPAVASASPIGETPPCPDPELARAGRRATQDPELVGAARELKRLMDRIVILDAESDRVRAGLTEEELEGGALAAWSDRHEAAVLEAANAAQKRLYDLLSDRGLCGCVFEGVLMSGPLSDRYGTLRYYPDTVHLREASRIVSLDA